MTLINDACIYVPDYGTDYEFGADGAGIMLPALPGQACNEEGVHCVGGSRCNSFRFLITLNLCSCDIATGTCECLPGMEIVNGQCKDSRAPIRPSIMPVPSKTGKF